MGAQHFLTLSDLSNQQLQQLIDRGIELKASRRRGEIIEPLKNKVLAMIFEKSSTRTRVSFEAGMVQLGGQAMFLSPRDTQLGRGEPVEDSAKVISSMVDGVMIRTFDHQTIETFAEHSSVPVINGLTDEHHPCQLLADMMTLKEIKGGTEGLNIAWVGDGNNMCISYMEAAKHFGFNLNIATPSDYKPADKYFSEYGSEWTPSPKEAVEAADVVVTDVWASMGQEDEAKERIKAFMPYQVNEALMQLAKDDVTFLHCLPAHRGEEISDTLLDGPYSAAFQEAENRLHAQKALMELLMS